MTRNTNLRWSIGAVTITRVEECVVPLLWDRLVPEGAGLVESCQPWIEPFADQSHLLLSIHSFVIETPETLIVVDTCIGDSGRFEMEGNGTFGDRLAAMLPGGFDSVDVVVCTHLHFDHVGWNTVEIDGLLVPRFGNARYLVTEDELAAERDEEDTMAYQRSIEPLAAAGCLQPVPADHRVDPWVALEPSPGHTPGHASVRITDEEASGTNTALITGDIVHTPLQLAYPEASSRSDGDPERAIATRKRYLAEVTGSDILVLGTHFPPPTGGHLVGTTTESGVRFASSRFD